MPACAVHLLSLSPSCTIPQFLTSLRIQTDIKPLTIARVIRWIILPTSIATNELLAQNIHWDLLLILPNTSPLPASVTSQIAHQYTITTGIPSKLLLSYENNNHVLLHPKSPPPALTGSLIKPILHSTSQDLSLSSTLYQWISEFRHAEGSGPVSMLNFLAFHPGKKESYLEYGRAFSSSIGSRHGGEAKLVGTVIREGRGGNTDRLGKADDGWDEFALAHYPSIAHFADMIASEDYQKVNQKFRVPSLRDTCILCTSELGMDEYAEKGIKEEPSGVRFEVGDVTRTPRTRIPRL